MREPYHVARLRRGGKVRAGEGEEVGVEKKDFVEEGRGFCKAR